MLFVYYVVAWKCPCCVATKSDDAHEVSYQLGQIIGDSRVRHLCADGGGGLGKAARVRGISVHAITT